METTAMIIIYRRRRTQTEISRSWKKASTSSVFRLLLLSNTMNHSKDKRLRIRNLFHLAILKQLVLPSKFKNRLQLQTCILTRNHRNTSALTNSSKRSHSSLLTTSCLTTARRFPKRLTICLVRLILSVLIICKVCKWVKWVSFKFLHQPDNREIYRR